MIDQMKEKLKNLRGQLTLQIMVFGFIAVIILGGFSIWASTNLGAGTREFKKLQAFTIAESGIEYYRWHLAHDNTDFQDGTGVPGPYVHPFFDKDDNRIGEFILDITAPATGTTIATVRSTGHVDSSLTVEKIVEARMGIPSFAQYSAVANAAIRFGAGTTVFGLLHSNDGIRFDGFANNLVTSAVADYDDPDHSGGNEFGVHTHVAPVDPLPPAAVPARTDVFAVGRNFPVPVVDFSGITQDLAQIRTDAQADGFYRADSGVQGYEIVLRTDDTFDLFSVDTLQAVPDASCSDPGGQPEWGTWSVGNTTNLGNFAFPNNGLIFIEDHAWVRGQIDEARLTIGAGRFPDNPTTWASITVNNDLLYTNYDGTDAISLIAQRNINSGLYSADTYRIDAAIIAQNGRAGRYYYTGPVWWNPGCSPWHDRDTLTLYGMIGSNQRYGFAYTDGTGYDNRIIIYDGNLLYGPPPSFPLAASEYEILTWEEVK